VAESPPAALARIEAEISVALTEPHDQLVHRIAVALVEVAAAERVARNGNGNSRGVSAPKLCTICRARVAADHRTICHSCRGHQRRERERLRKAHVAELRRVAAGERGERAREVLLGEREMF